MLARNFVLWTLLCFKFSQANITFNIDTNDNDQMENIVRLCQFVTRASKSKEIYLLKKDAVDGDDYKHEIISLQRYSAVVLKTFSSLKSSAERKATNCENGRNEGRALQGPYTVVLILRPSPENMINLFYDRSSSPSTVFMFVVEQLTQRIENMIRKSWKSNYTFRVLIFSNEEPAAVTVFDPLRNCERQRLGGFQKMRASEYKRASGYLTRTIKSLNGCSLSISMYEREQTAVLLPDNKTFAGQDGKLIDLLSEKMNFTPRINLMKGKMTYGFKIENGTYVGTFVRLIDGTSDLSLNGHFIKNYNCDVVELTRQITSDRVCLLTPKAGIMPPMMTVLKSFQSQVWIMIIVAYATLVFSFHVCKNLTSKYENTSSSPVGCLPALDIFRTMVATPLSRKLRNNYEKILFALCGLFATVILNSFQGSLVTFLNTPMHFSDIDTFDELIASGLPLRTSSLSFSELLLSDQNLVKLERKLYFSKNVSAVKNFQGRFAGFQRINVHNLKYFKDVKYLLNEKETRLLHTMKQCLMSYFVSYAIRKDSPFKKRINEIISAVDRAGLIMKWNGDAAKYIFEKYKLITKEPKSTKVFSLTDLEVAFFVFVCGLLASTITFWGEMIIYRRNYSRKINVRFTFPTATKQKRTIRNRRFNLKN